ncbi:RNA-binding protein [Kamptonema animale CS-326]|jgi:RNA recognition motif-containing protein|uniref:RNA recognition motif domain-containing protein n=1 Tax=Kamptonema animale TaxID=92934 RepID=UPI00232F21A9|nr:RNA-binding protein [Kamptonema animale]MDB9514050.1 RNA-binding protein [Kamptonema animale CS-326]
MSIRLYVGNLPKELERQELQAVFAEEGESVSAKVITDRKTGKCRGFGFVTVATDEQADQVIEKYNGFMFKENPLKIEKALPRSKGGKGEKGDEDQPQQQSQSQPQSQQQPPQQRSAPSTGGGGGGGGGKSGGRRRGGDNKSRRGAGAATSYTADSGSVQPDPRWASALEELKQRLAAAQTNT